MDGDWDTSTANWKNNISPGLAYADGNTVVFNDAATGATNVNLTTTLFPASVTVSNNVKTYAFVDLGKLSGAAGLTKQGTGALIIANEDANDFTGGVAIYGGTVRVGDGGTNGSCRRPNPQQRQPRLQPGAMTSRRRASSPVRAR